MLPDTTGTPPVTGKKRRGRPPKSALAVAEKGGAGAGARPHASIPGSKETTPPSDTEDEGDARLPRTGKSKKHAANPWVRVKDSLKEEAVRLKTRPLASLSLSLSVTQTGEMLTTSKQKQPQIHTHRRVCLPSWASRRSPRFLRRTAGRPTPVYRRIMSTPRGRTCAET